MSLTIQCIIACAIFTAIILPSVYKDPLSHIMSYPPAIRKRVESLPQYQHSIVKVEKKHIVKKIIAAIFSTILLAVIAYFSGATSFGTAFYHVFVLFMSVNIFDMIVLDIGIFCHSKKTIIPGTEDMINDYRSPWHHVYGAILGTGIGAAVALLSASFVLLVTTII